MLTNGRLAYLSLAAAGFLGSTTLACTGPRALPGSSPGPTPTPTPEPTPYPTPNPTPTPYPTPTPTPGQGLSIVRRTLSVGVDYSCQITPDGALYCWGQNQAGQIGDGTTQPRAVPTRVGTDADWLAVSTGHSNANDGCSSGRPTTCGIRAGGRLFCWGANDGGQLGDGTSVDRAQPTEVDGGAASDWVTVSVGGVQTCGIRSSGALYCWGGKMKDPYSYVGCTRDAGPSRPVQLAGGADVVDVAVAGTGGCARRRNGTLACWSQNPAFDNPTLPPALFTIGNDADWIAVSAGDGGQICGLRAPGALWCGMLAPQVMSVDGGAVTSGLTLQSLARVGTGADWVEISVWHAQAHACARDAAGAVSCWGTNSRGQLGTGDPVSNKSVTQPAPVAAPAGFTAVAAGGQHACGQRADGSVLCWGSNVGGRLGIGSFAEKLAPALAGPESDWTSVGPTYGIRGGRLFTWGFPSADPVPAGPEQDWVAFQGNCGIRAAGAVLACRDRTGAAYAVDLDPTAPAASAAAPPVWREVSDGYSSLGCAIATDGSLYCWGGSMAGQDASSGRTVNRARAVPIAPGESWLHVSATNTSACGVRSDHTLWCWTRPTAIGNGDGSLASVPVPKQFGADADWELVSVASYQVCGIRGGGHLSCFRPDYPAMAPLVVAGEAWTAASSGGSGGPGCAIDADRALWCWKGVAAPAGMAPIGDWMEVQSSYDHVCARRADGTRWCWGQNDMGQLGDGDAWRTTPVPVAAPIAAP